LTPVDLDALSELVRVRSGQVLRGDRAFYVETRLAPLARRQGAVSVTALVEQFRGTGDELLARGLVEALAVGETAFFRDPAVFRDLAEVVLPELAARRPGGGLRLWSAGCSTGQEPYSLAILLAEPTRGLESMRAAILGSDLSERALEKARAGLYTQFEVQRGLPIRMMLKHFAKVDDAWRVSDRLREAVRWGRLNLLDDFSRIGRVDVILCRHVLSQMDPSVRFSVLERLSAALADDGCLVCGAGEVVELAGYDALRPGSPIFLRNPGYARAAA